MLESVVSGLSACKGGSCSSLSTVALAKYGSHSCASRIYTGQSSLAGRLRKIRRTRSSVPLEHGYCNSRSYLTSPWAQFRSHSSSCLFTGAGAFGLAIRHVLRPSRQFPTSVTETPAVLGRRLAGAGGSFLRRGKGLQGEAIESNNLVAVKPGMLTIDGFGVENSRAYGRSLYGWWGSSWNSRSTRWLQGRHSVWLMFGVCACFSDAAGAPVPVVSPTNPVRMEAGPDDAVMSEENASDDSENRDVVEDKPREEQEAKQVYTNYTITGVPGDGRCLFRAVAHGACLRKGFPAPSEGRQRELADELRNKAVEELVKRRDETEWFIEGNFDSYTRRMRQPHVWGGEPELLMLSHVLKMPITVYMADRKLKGLIAIAEYGQDYGKDDPVRVLYHGFGHYEALQMPCFSATAKL